MRIAIPLLALALLSTGCIANMADLKEKVQPAAVEDALPPQPVEAAANATNVTPPVARIQVFGANNALLYKADFKAANVTTPLVVPKGVEVTFLSGDSDALAPGAKVAKAVWTVNGKTIEGAKATATLDAPGLYPLVLTVTDTLGATDAQSIPLGVMPDPFDVVTNLTSAQMVGANGEGAQSLPFDLAVAAAGKPATIQAVTVRAAPGLTCDVALALEDPAGEPLGDADDADATSGDQAEELAFGALPEGAYAIVLTPNACIAKDGVPVSVTVTFLEVIAGLTDAGDGHGGHAH